MKKHTGVLIAVRLICILSLIVSLYSFIQIIRAPIEARQSLNNWEKKRETASAITFPSEEAPLPEGMVSPPKENLDSSPLYAKGEVIGEINFPSLNKRIAILEGTESPQLKKGAGHYVGSAAIGALGNSVLAGHRDTVFRNLGELVSGDLIEVESMDGKYVYEVTGSSIVDGNERNAIKQSDEASLTLITCYPFSYVGSAPDRYLLSARLIRNEPTS